MSIISQIQSSVRSATRARLQAARKSIAANKRLQRIAKQYATAKVVSKKFTRELRSADMEIRRAHRDIAKLRKALDTKLGALSLDKPATRADKREAKQEAKSLRKPSKRSSRKSISRKEKIGEFEQE